MGRNSLHFAWWSSWERSLKLLRFSRQVSRPVLARSLTLSICSEVNSEVLLDRLDEQRHQPAAGQDPHSASLARPPGPPGPGPPSGGCADARFPPQAARDNKPTITRHIIRRTIAGTPYNGKRGKVPQIVGYHKYWPGRTGQHSLNPPSAARFRRTVVYPCLVVQKGTVPFLSDENWDGPLCRWTFGTIRGLQRSPGR